MILAICVVDCALSDASFPISLATELPAVTFNQAVTAVSDDKIASELESVRLRLELEAETQIEQAVTVFRARLHAAAQEEIDYILKNSNFSKE